MEHPNTIEVEGLVREFKKGPRAVDGIDLRVEPGEIYGFLGPNGAGKSTTVLMLVTLLPPTAGTARVAGFDVVKEGPSVRATIGAALQEAALDPLLTGREHLRLQAALQALPREDRKARSDELLERVGLTDAADRKVKGYSGGMKRRLDLALALVHRPRVLFLDEPTTGLDPQSRSALWQEVARLARDDGVTVFLTTQYLEEADVLADRVGIIDHGHIVAEGTPAALKAEVGRPTLEAIPADPAELEHLRAILSRFGEPSPSSKGGAVRLASADGDLAAVVRALDAEHVRVEQLQVHQPSLDDVFLAKTGRSLEGAGRRGRGGLRHDDGLRSDMSATSVDQVFLLARRSVVRTVRQPANVIGPLVFPMMLLAVNSGGLKAETHLPGFPTHSFVAFALAVPFIQGALFATMNSGTDLARDIQTGLPEPALADADARRRAARGTARRRRHARRRPGGLLPRSSAWRSACGPAAGIGGVAVLLVFSALIALAFGAAGQLRSAEDRLRRGDPEPVPDLLRLPVHLVDEHPAQPDRRDVVPRRGHDQPGLVPARVRAQPDHHGLGRRGARARVRHRRARRGHGADARRASAAAEARAMRNLTVAQAVAWRTLHNVFTNKALVIPQLAFPLFFFAAFAGGLSRIHNVPGFNFPENYTSFQFVFVLLQSAAFGGVFTGFGIARDFEGGFAKRLMLAAPHRTGIVLGLRRRGTRPLARHRRLPDRGRLRGRDQGRRQRGRPARALPARGDPEHGRALLGVRRGDAAAHDAGRAGDADAGVPRALLRAGLRAAEPAQGLDPHRRGRSTR